MSTDDPPRPLRQGHYRAGIIGLGGIAVNRAPTRPIRRWGSIWPTWPSLGFLTMMTSSCSWTR